MMYNQIVGFLGWLAFAGFVAVLVLTVAYILGFSIFALLRDIFPKRKEPSFSLSKEIEEFKKRKRKQRGRREEKVVYVLHPETIKRVKGAEKIDLVRAYLMEAIKVSDIRTVENELYSIRTSMETEKLLEEDFFDSGFWMVYYGKPWPARTARHKHY